MASQRRIKRKFKELRARGEAALVPFVVAGDPNLDTTRRLILELEARGADLIEIGVPFSDPMADGPANQRALARGLGAGASLAAILSMVSELRTQTEIPLILFGYYNPVFHYGCERLCTDAARAGVDALLIVDLPPDEAGELKAPARANDADRASAQSGPLRERFHLLCLGDRGDRRAHRARIRHRGAREQSSQR